MRILRVTILWILELLLSTACELVHVVLIRIPCAISTKYRDSYHHSLWNGLIRFWGRASFFLLKHVGGVEVIVEGDVPEGRHLVVVNHQSTAEIVVLFEVLHDKNLKFVAKSELTHGIPSISRALRDGGFGFVDFGNPRGSLRGLAAFARGLAEWDGSAVIYPEGQRTLDGSMARFHRSGTELIQRESGLPILPVVTDGLFRARTAREFWRHLVGSRCRVRILPVVPAGDGLMERLETTMRNALAEMRR